jgi:hypothetical protein
VIKRVLAYGLISLVLIGLGYLFRDSLPNILTILVLFVAAPLNWFVTAWLWRLAHQSPAWVLKDRFDIALAVSVIVTVFGLVFYNNTLTPPPLNGYETQVVTRGAILVLSTLTAFYWLLRARRASRIKEMDAAIQITKEGPHKDDQVTPVEPEAPVVVIPVKRKARRSLTVKPGVSGETHESIDKVSESTNGPDAADPNDNLTVVSDAVKEDSTFKDGTPSGDDIPDENDSPNANKSVDVEDDEA